MSGLEKTLDANGNIIKPRDPVTLWINGKKKGNIQEMTGHPGWTVKEIITGRYPKVRVPKWAQFSDAKYTKRILVVIEHPGYPQKMVGPEKLVKSEESTK